MVKVTEHKFKIYATEYTIKFYVSRSGVFSANICGEVSRILGTRENLEGHTLAGLIGFIDRQIAKHRKSLGNQSIHEIQKIIEDNYPNYNSSDYIALEGDLFKELELRKIEGFNEWLETYCQIILESYSNKNKFHG